MDTIIATEDRKLFADKLAEIKETIAPSSVVTNLNDAVAAAKKLGLLMLMQIRLFSKHRFSLRFAVSSLEPDTNCFVVASRCLPQDIPC